MTRDRNNLTYGTYEPDYDTTGVPAGTSLTQTYGDVTINTDGTVLDGLFINGRLTINAADVVVQNSKIVGTNAAPPAGANLVDCRPVACSNALIKDCEIYPQYAHPNWGDAVIGHDYTAERVLARHVTDGFGVYNTHVPVEYPTNVNILGCWVYDLSWWTSSTSGVLSPTNETHNDCIQVQGGYGTNIIGNSLWGVYARQYGHWHVTDPTVEPFVSVPLNSLPDGGPWRLVPDRGNGNDASGRYNWDSVSGLMVNNNVGHSYGFTVTDNYFRGGNYAINAGGVAYAGFNFGDVLRNVFDTRQGAQSSGVPNTDTLVFGSGWNGHVNSGEGTIDANRYIGQEIRVRKPA